MEPHSVQSVPALAVETIDDIDATSGGEVRGRSAFVEGEGLGRGGAIAKLKSQMTGTGTKRLGTNHLVPRG